MRAVIQLAASQLLMKKIRYSKYVPDPPAK